MTALEHFEVSSPGPILGGKLSIGEIGLTSNIGPLAVGPLSEFGTAKPDIPEATPYWTLVRSEERALQTCQITSALGALGALLLTDEHEASAVPT